MKIKSHSDRQPVTGGVAAAIPGCRGAGASSPAERDVVYTVRDRAEQSALLPKRLALRPPPSALRIVAAAILGCRGAGASSPAERDVVYSVRDRAEQRALLPRRLAFRPRPSALRTGNTPHSAERGIALVITLIMLAITLVMAVAFLAIAHRERASVDTQTDTEVSRLAADSALANAEAQIVAGMLSGPSNAYNLGLLVSTNYINNQFGFNPAGGGNPTNVNYNFIDGTVNPVLGLNLEQNISNLWYLPRAPVYIPLGQPVTNYDFRYYLDLNENGRYDTNYFGPDFDYLGNPIPGTFYQHVGDPEWVGMLEHPDAPHGPNNHFTSRYAFIAIPVGNAMDVNYAYNQSQLNTLTSESANGGRDRYMRNQGVGTWELNLAAFLADLNTNIWGESVGSGVVFPPGAGLYYLYQPPPYGTYNRGVAFDDARAILAYRYNANALSPASSAFNNYNQFLSPAMDNYSDGNLQTTLDHTNLYLSSPSPNPNYSWSGSDNTNHFFTPDDFFNPNNFIYSGELINNNFATHLKATGTNTDSYNRYTYYRMLEQLGTDSAADDGRLNLNYSNAVVSYKIVNGSPVPLYQGVSVVTGAETNLVPWNPQNFFCAAADMMIRYYTTNWYNSDTTQYKQYYTNVFAVTAPFSLTNIPVWVSNRFVYTPAVHRLLQLAANLYDATTNGPVFTANVPGANLPHVFRPIFERVNNGINGGVGDIFIVGYTNVAYVTGTSDDQLHPPYDITQLSQVPPNTPIVDNQRVPINVYGVPWIIGAKKGLPAFNQLYLTNYVQVNRKLQFTRPGVGQQVNKNWTTNQMYVLSFNTGFGASFWNSYTNTYYAHDGKQLVVLARDQLSTSLTVSNSPNSPWTAVNYLNLGDTPSATETMNLDLWPATEWYGGPAPYATIYNPNTCFLAGNWQTNFLNSPVAYNFASSTFVPVNNNTAVTTFFPAPTTPPLPQLPQMYLAITNHFQAYILDGNNVIDYVQFRDPSTVGNINATLADPIYPDGNNIFYQWSPNAYPPSNPNNNPTYGVYNQFVVSGNASKAPPEGGQWADPQSFLPPSMYSYVQQNNLNPNAAEAAYFAAFFTGTPGGEFYFNGQIFYNTQDQIQAPYTPSRAIFSPFLLQANDPLVHTLASDLNSQTGANAVWGPNSVWQNGVWKHIDNPQSTAIPTAAPATPVGGRYQPWGVQPAATVPGQDANPNTSGYKLAYKDPLAWMPDNWDFPTNHYPTPGWMGRVHRGSPWQTVYLKASDVLTNVYNAGSLGAQNFGVNLWSAWTGDLQPNDAAWSAPVQDRTLFDIFTTRLNDNAVHGTVPVNAGAGRPDGGLADWSALFSGMVVLTDTNQTVGPGSTVTNYAWQVINPVGTNVPSSPLWQIVNNPTNGIVATRTNMPLQSFMHAGDILDTMALTEESPFLNWTNQAQQQWGINDEMYEWLPQQMMGLVRSSETRYVLYCFGQTLRPAPGGTVLNGPFFQMVTNYQVVAESAIRAVVHVDNSNTNNPHIVVESYNVLPPN